jgi:OOP family OmpA-OmpF porin
MPRHPTRLVWMALALIVPMAAAAESQRPAAALRVPLCEGLTVVTAISDAQGDFESIKRVVHIDSATVRLRYSAEVRRPGYEVERASIARTIRREDLENAHDYQGYFYLGAPEVYPGSTAIGVSAGVLKDLETTGHAQLRIPSTGMPGAADTTLAGTLTRVEPGTVPFKVLLNDEAVEVPTVHARGTLGEAAADFWILDDPANPLALRWSIGARRQNLQVIKLSYPVTTTTAARETTKIERDLSSAGRTVVYGIYFDFASDRIKDESDSVLAMIGAVLEKNPAWSLAVEGHTDSIGGEAANLDLSKRRAAAVKQALVTRFQVNAKRLQASGYGASRPNDTNDTLEGRARNRRVELVKVG